MDHIIFDVGSYNGDEFIELARTSSNCKVYAFEPHPEYFEIIKQKTKDLDNFKVFDCALSSHPGTAELYLGGGCSSLLPYLGTNPDWNFKGKDVVQEKVVIKLKTLQDIIEELDICQIDYLHVDAQGHDLEVLKGLGKYAYIVRMGVAEVQLSPLYQNSHTPEMLEQWFVKKGWSFFKWCKVNNDSNAKEDDWYFFNPIKNDFNTLKKRALKVNLRDYTAKDLLDTSMYCPYIVDMLTRCSKNCTPPHSSTVICNYSKTNVNVIA